MLYFVIKVLEDVSANELEAMMDIAAETADVKNLNCPATGTTSEDRPGQHVTETAVR